MLFFCCCGGVAVFELLAGVATNKFQSWTTSAAHSTLAASAEVGTCAIAEELRSCGGIQPIAAVHKGFFPESVGIQLLVPFLSL